MLFLITSLNLCTQIGSIQSNPIVVVFSIRRDKAGVKTSSINVSYWLSVSMEFYFFACPFAYLYIFIAFSHIDIYLLDLNKFAASWALPVELT